MAAQPPSSSAPCPSRRCAPSSTSSCRRPRSSSGRARRRCGRRATPPGAAAGRPQGPAPPPTERGGRGPGGADRADHASRLALAQRYAGDKRYREALDELLEIVRRDKTWRDGEARRQILNILNLAADQSLASEYRRKLASAIY